jgi:hypothetical protein
MRKKHLAEWKKAGETMRKKAPAFIVRFMDRLN